MEEEPSGLSPDMLATAEPSSSETGKEVLSPGVTAAATSFSMGEESGPDQTATLPVWDHGGLEGAQQGSSSAPDSEQPGLGSTSTVSGTNEDLRPPRRRPPPGKLFRCSALSCTETFPSMQELVAHGKLHYKPNRYFKCENCLLRFRTHRSLFKHLHVCAEQGQSPAPPPPPALDKEPSAPERPLESDPASAPSLQFPLLEPFMTPAPAPTGPFLPYLNPTPFDLSPPRLRPFLAAAPGLPASSAAVWKKSQGAGGSPRRPQGGSDAPSGACR
ncbi:zinc finger protein 414 [Phyllostomus discolor]|uniref:Zinc finger protein 414 n=1 Tax=Phyllostomus discolor TaxID=89673 RepID=A0A833ZQM1_9CHIR|nr:zinc finger protein 414 [Phyllostomus discolor]